MRLRSFFLFVATSRRNKWTKIFGCKTKFGWINWNMFDLTKSTSLDKTISLVESTKNLVNFMSQFLRWYNLILDGVMKYFSECRTHHVSKDNKLLEEIILYLEKHLVGSKKFFVWSTIVLCFYSGNKMFGWSNNIFSGSNKTISLTQQNSLFIKILFIQIHISVTFNIFQVFVISNQKIRTSQ